VGVQEVRWDKEKGIVLFYGKPRRRWKDNIKINLRDVGWGGTQTGLIWLRIGTGGGLL
jgi:hypothetical protein